VAERERMEMAERWALVRSEGDHPEFLVIAGYAHDTWKQAETGRPGFASFEIAAVSLQRWEGDELVEDSPIAFPLAGGMSSADMTSDLADAERFAHGDVKWDGCANFLLDDNEVMLHICDPGGMARIGEALCLAYEICADICGAPDGR
jgi:hypothetical protein